MSHVMKTYKIYQSKYPYHIINRTNNKEFLFELRRDAPAIWTCLRNTAWKTGFQNHHFIVLTNHFHLVGSTPKSNLFEVMQIFQTMISKIICANHNRINHIFGSRYSATVVNSEQYQRNLIRYLYQNSVKAGLAFRPQDYRYSTLNYYLNDTWEKHDLFLDPLMSKMNLDERRRFLLKDVCNTPLDERAEKDCRSKLRKCVI
jgi:REP element-mobilizing transposase RayT